jgi:flagellar biosynthesis protein FlhG
MVAKPVIEPVVLPVGGGKGGIGKSALTASLGLALARLERTVTLVDADLGGSDLHNFLGLENDRPGLGEVLTAKDMKLNEAWHSVLEPRLKFVPGDAMVVATANPSFQKKRKLLHAIKNLPSDFVLLDLGAGTAITVMDFYLTSPVALVVMLPERPAVLNAFNFLKNGLFRALERIFRDNAATKRALAVFQSRSRGPGAMKVAELIAAMEEALPGAGERAARAVERWRPKLVLNRVRRVDDFAYARQLERWAREAAAAGRVALDLNPRAPFCRAVALLAWKISQWSGKGPAWAAHRVFEGSFERAATEFAPLFPPPAASPPAR